MPNIFHAPVRTKQRLRHQFLNCTSAGNSWQNISPPVRSDQRNTCNTLPKHDADNATLLYRQCLQSLHAGNIALALDLITRACSRKCAPAEYYRVKADVLQRCGKLDEAVCALRFVIELEPEDAVSWGLLGNLFAKRKELNESRRCFETAVRLNPSLIEMKLNLAVILQLLGHVEEAEAHYREVARHAPFHLEANLNLAGLLNTLGRYQEALSTVAGVLARAPKVIKASVIASAIKFNMRQYSAALNWIEHAIALAPDQIQLLTRRASIFAKLGHKDYALADCNKVLEHFPNDIDALREKSFVLRSLNRADESLACLLQAEAVSPDPNPLLVQRAWLLAELGDKDQALQILGKTLSAQPDLASALECRSFLIRLRPSHSDVTAMEKIIGNPNAPINDRMRLSFSIGRVYLDADDGAKAFSYLNLGNYLKRKNVAYNRAIEEQWFTGIMSLFSTDNIAQLSSKGIERAMPIFVFGMPRSGTTLVEQILASHHLVRGTGESSYLDTLARTSIFSLSQSGFTSDNLRSCANRYLELVSANLPASMRFVDKTNSNFLYAGLISLLFPGARMIHCRRSPLDTCLSCYSLLFANGHEFSYNLAELGHYYGLYRQMMAHWSNLLSADMLLEINYESVVDDTETQVKRILDFCKLPWDEACLRFYETNRLVTTSSLNQVRSPVYKTSVGRAERFRPWLGDLVEALESIPQPAI